MNIIHLSPGLRPGGSCQLAADLACTLQGEDSQNLVLSPANELVSRLSAAGVRHIPCRRPNLLTLTREVRRIGRLIRSFRPDVIQAYTPEAAWVAGLACRMAEPALRPPLIGALTSYPRKGLAAKGWRFCTAFTAISKHLRKVCAEASPLYRQRRPWVIPYGINSQLCSPSYRPSESWLEQWQRTQPETTRRLTLCIPCPITPRQGLEDLVEILSILLRSGIPAHALIAGDTRKANALYLEQLRTRFHEAQLSSHITWLGVRPDLRDVLCACDITLSLAHEPATFNRPILEALALGRPVTGYDHGVVGELLEGFMPEGRVKPQDAAAMADTITQWNTYRPSPLPATPYPYRITDTASNYQELYQDLKTKATL